ncbi:MAG: M23 family metallopeptidase [Candidatus Woesearchaeota archaeon]
MKKAESENLLMVVIKMILIVSVILLIFLPLISFLVNVFSTNKKTDKNAESLISFIDNILQDGSFLSAVEYEYSLLIPYSGISKDYSINLLGLEGNELEDDLTGLRLVLLKKDAEIIAKEYSYLSFLDDSENGKISLYCKTKCFLNLTISKYPVINLKITVIDKNLDKIVFQEYNSKSNYLFMKPENILIDSPKLAEQIDNMKSKIEIKSNKILKNDFSPSLSSSSIKNLINNENMRYSNAISQVMYTLFAKGEITKYMPEAKNCKDISKICGQELINFSKLKIYNEPILSRIKSPEYFFNCLSSDTEYSRYFYDKLKSLSFISNHCELIYSLSNFDDKNGKLLFPVKRGRIVAIFGEPRDRSFHKGIDIAPHVHGFDNNYEIPIYAAHSGYVSFAGIYYNGGNTIILTSFDGKIRTYYMHLKKLFVFENMYVKKGEIIGVMGNTGRSQGTHLHYQVELYDENRRSYMLYDPILFFDYDFNGFSDLKNNYLKAVKDNKQYLFKTLREAGLNNYLFFNINFEITD